MGGPSQPGTQQYGQYMGPAGQFMIPQVDATGQFIALQTSHFHGDTAQPTSGQSVSQSVSRSVRRSVEFPGQRRALPQVQGAEDLTP